MLSDIDVKRELERIDTYLTTLESRSETLSARAARFIEDHIFSEGNDPIVYLIAANYLKWVISKGSPKDEKMRRCRCVGGWMEKPDGTVYPCDRCRPEQNELWWQTAVDEDELPR